MNVLMVSRYVEPDSRFMNANVFRQAKTLKAHHGVDLEILTWPSNDLWKGVVPDKVDGMRIPPLRVETAGLSFRVINPDEAWDDRTLSIQDWERAVEFGVRILKSLKPDIVHLQHWIGLWWILEAAQRLGLGTIYSNHDWGIACLRTVLVMGNGSLCDGRVLIDKCSHCIQEGRGLLGRTNELVVETAFGRRLLEAAYQSPVKSWLRAHGAVRLPIRERVGLNLTRVNNILAKVDAVFTPSQYGRSFFAQLGVREDRISVQPWYHDPVERRKAVTPLQPFTITYVGRVSPEKGIHIVFEALKRVASPEPIQLRIAGANLSPYCEDLQRKYPRSVGIHKVEWLGWSEVEPLLLTTDVTIIPSVGIDNTPLSLVEAFAYQVPVIATKVPPIEELVVDGSNGYLAEFGSVESLTAAIQRAASQKDKIRGGGMPFPRVKTCIEYTQAVKDMYLEIARMRTT